MKEKRILHIITGSLLAFTLLSSGCKKMEIEFTDDSSIVSESSNESSVEASESTEESIEESSEESVAPSEESAVESSEESTVESSTEASEESGVAFSDPNSFVDTYQVSLLKIMDEIPQSSFKNSFYFIKVEEPDYEQQSHKSSLMEASRKLPEVAEGDSKYGITKNLHLPTEYDGVKIRWYSSDETLLEADGTVHRPHDESKYVVLSGEFTDGDDVMIQRYILRIERDMYADKTFKDVFELEYYDNIIYFDVYGIDLSDLDGWCYLLDDWEQLYFFEGPIENLSVYIDKDSDYNKFKAYGTLCDMRIESRHEADLLLYALKNLIKADISKGDLQYESCMNDSVFMRYDYQQYYQGLKVNGGTVTMCFNYADTNKSVSSCLVPIPDGFDATPKVTADEIKEKIDAGTEPELLITMIDGKARLVWLVYEKSKPEGVFFDAKNGTEIKRFSTVIID